MSSQAQFPLVLLRDLPKLAITPDSETTIPVVQNNTLTGRISWDLWTAELAKLQTTTPTEPSSHGEEGRFAADSTGIYAYKHGEWHKAPIYNAHWDELGPDTRFLLVNSEMELTDTEIKNARASLKIQIADQETPGLIRSMNQQEQNACAGAPLTINQDGTAYIASATGTIPGVFTVWDGTTGSVATTDYVAQQIALIKGYILPIAAPGKLGGIQSDAEQPDGTPGIFTVTSEGQVKIRSAYIPSEPNEEDGFGLVKIAGEISANDTGVVPANTLHSYLQNWFSEAYGVATPLQAGIVRPYVEGVWSGAYIRPTGDNVGPLFFRDNQGGIDIYPAGANVPGVVLAADTVPENSADIPVNTAYPILPTLRAAKTYIDNKLTTVKVAVAMEPASKVKAGAVLPADNAFIVTDDGTLTIKDALPGTRGLARIASEVRPDQDNLIPDVGLLREYATGLLLPIRATISNMQEQLEALTSQSAGLQGQLDSIYAGDNPNMSSDYFGVQGDISGIHQLLLQSVSNVAFLTDVSNDNSHTIGQLQNRTAALEQTSGVLSEIADLSTSDMYSIVGSIANLTAAVEEMSSNMEGLVSDVAWLKTVVTEPSDNVMTTEEL
jgi:hypothetical protein